MSAEGTQEPRGGFTRREEVSTLIVAVVAGLALLLVGGDADETEADGPGNRRPSPGNFRASDPDFRYVVELPAGDGWSSPTERMKLSGELLRTTVRKESGPVVVIDRTPYDLPALGGETESSREISHPEFEGMIEYVFEDSTIVPACVDEVCVDYLVTDGRGGGWGVLVAGADRRRGSAGARPGP
jgi:hypothetical protein